jgi:nucleoside-diphosphate-sugar epimerase
VEDVATALVALAARRATGVFNICSGVPVTMRAVMETVGRIAGREDLIRFGERPYRDWEPMYLCGEPGRLKAQGWTPRWTLPDGLRNTFEWWARNDDAGERGTE